VGPDVRDLVDRRPTRASKPPACRAPVPLVPETRQPLPCPTCRDPIGTWTLHAIPIDRCERNGLWFDRDQLEIVLRAVGDENYRRRIEQR
jgi:hypothetical protein